MIDERGSGILRWVGVEDIVPASTIAPLQTWGLIAPFLLGRPPTTPEVQMLGPLIIPVARGITRVDCAFPDACGMESGAANIGACSDFPKLLTTLYDIGEGGSVEGCRTCGDGAGEVGSVEGGPTHSVTVFTVTREFPRS